MDKRGALKIALQFIQALPEKYQPRKAFLFGSYARGLAREWSDIDVAIVLNNYKDQFDTTLELMKLGFKIDTRIEPHPITEKDFNEGAGLATEIKKYGIPLTGVRTNSIKKYRILARKTKSVAEPTAAYKRKTK